MGGNVCYCNTGVTNLMKALVTGASGFIGNHVIVYLLKSGIDVIATSRNTDKAKSLSWFKNVDFIQYDLNELASKDLFKLFKKPDLMIHLAWEGLPHYKELFHIEKNLYQNYAFIKNLTENGLRRLSVVGTCLEYGMQDGCLKEDMPAMPDTPYSIAKDTLRRFISVLNKQYKFDYTWIRLFYVYGEGQSENSILSSLDRAIDSNVETFNMSGGEQLRDYLPVEKAAEYIVKISTQDKENGIFNCCSGKPISIRMLVENYLRERQKNIKLNLGFYEYTDYEPMAFWGCTDKMNMAISKRRKS